MWQEQGRGGGQGGGAGLEEEENRCLRVGWVGSGGREQSVACDRTIEAARVACMTSPGIAPT